MSKKQTEEKFSRRCKQCKGEFTTNDRRKVYCTRACGNTFRSKRWYGRAAKALKASVSPDVVAA